MRLTSRSGMMPRLGTGTMLVLVIHSTPLPSSEQAFDPGQHRIYNVLHFRIVGDQHDQDQHDGVQKHAVCRESPQQFGQQRQNNGCKDGSLHIAKAAENNDLNYFIGKKGVTHTALRPAGIGEFDGVKLNVVSNGEFIEPGEKVRVTRVDGNKILVDKA